MHYDDPTENGVDPEDIKSWSLPESNKTFPTCDAVGHCRHPSFDSDPFHHFYWDADRDAERMHAIHDNGAGHADPLSAYGAVVCKTCGRRALVLTENENEDFPAI